MDQSTEPTGAASQDVPMEDLHEDPSLLHPHTVKDWYQWITVEIRKYHVMNLMAAMMKRESFPNTPEQLKTMACGIESIVYRASNTAGEYTARLDAVVAHIPQTDNFLSAMLFAASKSNSTEGIAPAGPGTAHNLQLPHSQETRPMGQGLAPLQLPQGAVAAAAVPSPSPQPPAPPSSGPTAQALADEVRHIASGLRDLDMDRE